MNCFKINSKTLISIVFNLLIVNISLAQNYIFVENLIPFQDEFGKFGFLSQGNIAVKPKYDNFKMCDTNCDMIYDHTHDYCTRLIQVSLNGKLGLLNKEGAEIVPPKYDFIGACGYFCIERVDENGYSQTIHNNKYFYGSLIKVGLNNKFGYIDLDGKEIIKPIYNEINLTKSHLFEVKLGNKKGVLDDTGNEKITLKYEDIMCFRKGPFYAIAKLNGKWNFIDSTEKHIQINSITDSSINNYAFNIEEKRRYFSNLSKNIVMFDYSVLINKAEKKIIAVYDGINFYDSQENQNLFRVNLNGKYGFIDSTAKEVVPLIYDYNSYFNEGLALVGVKDSIKKENIDCECYDETAICKYGFIDKSGKLVIPLIYDKAAEFDDSKAHVRINERWFKIDKNGNEIK